MADWKPGDRVEHATYGTGTVIEFNDRHTVIHFDDQGRRTFASHLAVLAESQRQVRPPAGRRSRTSSERTTDIGYENLNEQVVVRQLDLPGSLTGQKVYVLKCRRCGTEYGANGGDILLRRCPACMGGPPGLAL
jgi:hypothetical protein